MQEKPRGVVSLSPEEEEIIESAEAEGEHMKAQGSIDYGGIQGVHSQYVQPQDAGAWLPAWELKKDHWGTEYGTPTRLPRGQIGHYLKKRRPDGGRRFTLREPPNLLPEPKFECFIGDCRKRVRDRALLIGHIRASHPQEAITYKPLLDELQQAITADNPRLAALVHDLAKTPDEAPRAVGDVEPTVPPPAVRELELSEYACPHGDWVPKPDAKNPRFALALHMKKHRSKA